MIWPKTLRARFGVWTGALLLTAFGLFGVYIYESMYAGLSEELDDSLLLAAAHVTAAIDVRNGELLVPRDLMERRGAEALAREFAFRIVAADGRSLLSAGPTYSLPDPSGGGEEPKFSSIAVTGGTSVRIYSVPVSHGGQVLGTVQVAQSFEEVETTMNRLLAALAIATPLLALVAGTGGYLLASRALAPIDSMVRTARRISTEGLGARLEVPTTEDELGRLAVTLDGMLIRLQESFVRERQFTTDASHELRTPLAAMIAILDAMRIGHPTAPEYSLAMDDLSAEAERLRTLTEDLLDLARRDGGTNAKFGPVDLSILVGDVVESMRPRAKSKGLVLACDVPVSATVIGDEDGLIRLFVNLLDNALKYTAAGSILISAVADAEHTRIRVEDTGAGVSEADLPRVFDRFYRGASSRQQQGAGLGLALASEIVRSHGGTIEIHSKEGSGTTVEVLLARWRSGRVSVA